MEHNQKKKGINEAPGKLIGKDEGPQRNSWFDEKWQIILEHKKRAYNKMNNRNTRQNEQEHWDNRKVACEIFRHKNTVLFKSKLEPMKIACNDNEEKNLIKK